MASLTLYITGSLDQWASWRTLVEGVSFGRLYMSLAARQCSASRAAKLFCKALLDSRMGDLSG